jgi:hypothetical protein
MSDAMERLSAADLDAEQATALPTKEVMSLLDVNANVDLGLDLAAPIDLAVAANLNIAAPIEAAASANVASFGSEAGALSQQVVGIDQHLSGDATATAPQESTIDQGATTTPEPAPAVAAPVPAGTSTVGDLSSGSLLDVNVDVNADVNGAAPIAGAVAANGNVAAPIDASVAANIGSIDSSATAIANQTAIIHQDLDGVSADATAQQSSGITQ